MKYSFSGHYAPADLTEIAGLIDSSWDMLSAVIGIPEIILTGKHIMDDGSKNRSAVF